MYTQVEEASGAATSQFAMQFDEYRRTRHDRYAAALLCRQQQAVAAADAGAVSEKDEDPGAVISTYVTSTTSATATANTTSTTTTTTTTTTSSSALEPERGQEHADNATLIRRGSMPEVPMLEKKRFSLPGLFGRRSSLKEKPAKEKEAVSKATGFWSSVSFTKIKESKKAAKERQRKLDDDAQAARLLEQLEMEGVSEREIAAHLQAFQFERDQEVLREVASEVASASRPSMVREFFKDIGDAFKWELQQRNAPEHCITIEVSSGGPYGVPLTYPFAYVPRAYPIDIDMSYENLMELEPVCTGVKSETLEQLPVHVYQGQELSSGSTCAVCLQEYECDEEFRSLRCLHSFHKECIDRWLAVSRTCPFCKSNVE